MLIFPTEALALLIHPPISPISPISPIETGIGIGIEIEIEIDPRSVRRQAIKHRNYTVALPGFSCPNPSPRPFNTEADSQPKLASPPTLSGAPYPSSG